MPTARIMFEPENLLYFNPFIFPDGGDPKPKFFVVLGEIGDTMLLASLPTSKDHIPSDVTLTSGCIEIAERMVNVSEVIQAKCLAFSDRIIKLNDYLLSQAANQKPAYKMVKGKRVYEKAVPIYLQSVSNLCNQLLRSGTSIGANNAEATNAISRQDFRSKSYIALKEARESLYWIDLLHRNNYLDDKQYDSIYADCEELVKILVSRCKKLDAELNIAK